MCLLTNKKIAQKYLKKWKGKKTVTVYKVFYIEEVTEPMGVSYGPYTFVYKKQLRSLYKRFCYKPGQIEAKTYVRAKVGTCKDGNEINHGLHVFLSRKGAQEFVPQVDAAIVKLQANPKDCVAIGTFTGLESAVFKKLTLSQREYDRAIA